MNKLGYVLATLLIMVCSPATKMTREILVKEIPEKPVLRIVQTSPIHLIYEGNLEPEFGKGNPDSLVNAFLLSRIRNTLSASGLWAGVEVSYLLDRDTLERRVIDYQRGKLWFDIPMNADAFSLRDSSDIVLFISSLGAKSIVETSDPDVPMLASIFPSKPLVLYAEFVYWSNQSGCPVVWGRKKVYENKSFTIKLSTWDRVSSKLAEEISDDFRKFKKQNQLARPKRAEEKN